ncbi:MAG: SIMPL domain-containing protein, partial [Pseudomonadota bacterium]
AFNIRFVQLPQPRICRLFTLIALAMPQSHAMAEAEQFGGFPMVLTTTRRFAVPMLVFSSALLILVSAAKALPKEVPTVSVSGTGIIKVAPDMAVLTLGVIREAKTARDAVTANNTAMGEILAGLKAEGIADKDLQTSGFSISPRYVYPKRDSKGVQPTPKIVGYVVNNALGVRIRDLESVGEILDRTINWGVNTGGNIRFTNADTESLLRDARALAVKDAVSRATTLVEAAGYTLGSILSIREGAAGPGPVPVVRARAMSVQEDAGSVPLAAGENEYRITVSINWEIAD